MLLRYCVVQLFRADSTNSCQVSLRLSSSRRLSKKRISILSALFIVAVAAGGWVFFFWLAPRTSGLLRQDVYVWQRAWTQPVRDAVSQHATNFAEIAVLKAEISWNTNRQPQLTRVAVDYDALAKARRPIGIALRIGTYTGPFTYDTIASFITDTASRIVTEARTNGVSLAELQIDFDCAESKLDGYRVWVEAIQRRVAPLPVTITALPSWLDSRAFKRLVAVTTNYVLQVHSVERPKSFAAPFTLCDPRAARRAMERAGRIGVPFRVALPTYGYTLAYNSDGKFISLSAEGPRPNWPTNAQLRLIESDAQELAELVRGWTASRPTALRGVIWYRLPVATDQHNWSWPTLQRVMRGEGITQK